MAPGQRKGIVKSGNAGNSSKASAKPGINPPPENGASTEKPLFPPGYKWPLSLLNERCQKLGWEKPIVEPRKYRDGYTCNITLTKVDKGGRDTVMMQPLPPLSLPTAIEAKHWVATYVLYRLFNNLQLNRLLPPGPREYWVELETEHKNAPEHLKWQYEPDPFAARKAVEQRQATAAKKRVAVQSSDPPLDAVREYEKAPEVRMSTSLREMVEKVIKESAKRYPGAIESDFTPEGPQFDKITVEAQLRTLGFTTHQLNRAITFLMDPSPQTSPYLASLLSLSPLDACISFLLVHTPESDLPPHFLSQQSSSDPFVRSGSSGSSTLSRRWLADRAAKEGGWPPKVVAELMEDLIAAGYEPEYGILTECLDCKLLGNDWADALRPCNLYPDREAKRTEEVEAVISVYPEAQFNSQSGVLSIPLPTDHDISLSVIFFNDHPYPQVDSRPPPMYISSSKRPPYIRLHLLSTVLSALSPSGDINSLLAAGEGVIFSAIECADAEWSNIRDAPPDVGSVMKHLLPPPTKPVADPALQVTSTGLKPKLKRGPRLAFDNRSNEEVAHALDSIARDPGYVAILEGRKKLPAWDARGDVVRMVESSRVVVVVGETGCGKTTQLPQFILDSCISSLHGAKTNIIITQPRRVSALSVAARVSAERMDDGSVGYAIRGESKQSRYTKLLFCTTGVLLRRLTLSGPEGLAGVSHIIVDEVHERSVDGDFLLLELRELLKTNKDIKIVLMSATINQKVFVDYFGGAPVLEIPGFTHPVKDLYLEDIIPHLDYSPPAARGGIKLTEDQLRSSREEYEARGLDMSSVRAIQNILRSERIDYQLLSAIVSHIAKTASDPKGAILIFLPGVQEIRQCIDEIRSSPTGPQAEIFPLHANLTSEEQRRVFLPTKKRKIVVATNVAETSITIPDVVYVVDSGKVKETQYDPMAGLSRLVETWVTKAAARQRRGRAGRTRPGECYKLFTRRQEADMKNFPVPEILRVPLESLSLQIKVMRENEDVKLFLGKAIDPPKVDAMEKAWSILEQLGAVDLEGHLTALGRQMALLPVDLRLGKMMILGAIFRCLDAALTIAACLSSKPLFLSPEAKRDEANKARAQFMIGNSDLLTDMNAYNQSRKLRTEGKSKAAQRSFLEDNFISASTVRDITSLRQDFFSALSDIGFVPLSTTATSPSLNVNGENINLIKSVVLGGLWPRVARVSTPKAMFDQVASGTIQRDTVAKEYKIFDKDEGRVFLHPSSVLFGVSNYKSPFLAYFSMSATSKTFLRDATEVPLYGLLLFGGHVTVDHMKGGITVGPRGWVKMKAWSRIGVLVNQLRRLLDAQLQESIEGAQMSELGDNDVVQAMLDLISRDGLSQD